MYFKAKSANETNSRPQPLLSQARGSRKTIRKSQKTLPRSRALHLYTARSEAKPLYQSTLYSLGFFKTYHLPCVRACVCFPGRTPLELLIFGNVAVLYESKHATRFRGQALPFFSALVSSGLLTMLPEDRSHRGDHSGERCPSKHHPPRPPEHRELASHHKSILHSGPWGPGQRFQKAEPLLSAFTSIYLGEKPSRAEKDIYISPLSPATTETLWFRRRPVAQLMKCLL